MRTYTVYPSKDEWLAARDRTPGASTLGRWHAYHELTPPPDNEHVRNALTFGSLWEPYIAKQWALVNGYKTCPPNTHWDDIPDGALAWYDDSILSDDQLGCHVSFDAYGCTDLFQNSLDGVAVHRLVVASAPVALTTKHIVTQLHTGGMLKVEHDRIDHRIVDGDVSVLLNLSGVLSLLLQNGEGGLEPELLIDQMGETKREQIADTKTKVDANDKEHIVSVSTLADEPVGDRVDVINALDRITGMLASNLVGSILDSRSDQTFSENSP